MSDRALQSQDETASKAKRVGKYAVIALLALVVLVVLLFLLGVLGVPDGGLADNEWGEVDNESIEVITTVWVENPNPFGLGGDADVEYTVTLQEVQLAEGSEENVGIESGNNSLQFTTDLYQNRLPAWWSSHLNNDEGSDLTVDVTVHAGIGPISGSPSTTVEDEIDTDIEGALDEAFSRFEGEYPEGAPSVEIRNVTTRWGAVTEDRTEIVTTVEIHNPELPNPAPVPTPAFRGSLVFNDIEMAQWNADEVELRDAEADAVIPPGETEERTFVVVMNNGNISAWFASHVDNGEFTEMVVSGQLVLAIDGNELTVPPEGALNCQFDMTTGIFVDQETNVAFQRCGVTSPEVAGDDGVLPTVASVEMGSAAVPDPAAQTGLIEIYASRADQRI